MKTGQRRSCGINHSPAGFEEVGHIVNALLPLCDDYGIDDARKRTLEVLLKIPSAVPEFRGLIARAENCDHRDYLASELSDLILGSVSSAHTCRDYPAEVISLVNTRLKLTDADLHDYHYSASQVDEVFGIRNYGVTEFSPPSAYQGPFGALLRSHPHKSLDFIISLLNHGGEWYGTQKWPEKLLEPAWQITIKILDYKPVQQWMNGRLFGMYRGMTVGPNALQSALMALEAWLMDIAKMESEKLESWLLHILRTSNNVMSTAVVASICIAYPEKAGKAGLVLLSNRELIECDLNRAASESSSRLDAFSGVLLSSYIYEQERKKSNELQHRRKHLESLAVHLQLTTKLREEVWRIIDRHRSELPDDQEESNLIWKLALHRMDVRGFKPVEELESTSEGQTEDVNAQIYFGPGNLEPDVQSMVDASSESMAITSRHLAFLNRARNAWEDRLSQESTEWRDLLSDAQAIEHEIEEAEEFRRGGPGVGCSALCA